ncbi:MAG: proline--tRNA ligase, partial [Planctomycetes bacterium]|nr:proline--tRNA ligase [Planctomycetota bacterium]
VYATSWGVSTRLVGALVMCHSDDAGLVLPPKLAPVEVVIVPILKAGADNAGVLTAAYRMAEPFGDSVRVRVDDRDYVSPGWKFNEWELKGVPIRIEVGPKDVEAGQAVLVRRDTGEKTPVPQEEVTMLVPKILEDIQASLLKRAKDRLEANCRQAHTYDALKAALDEGGFVFTPWCGGADCEAKISDETKATIRLVPDGAEESGACVICGKGPARRVPFARSY